MWCSYTCRVDGREIVSLYTNQDFAKYGFSIWLDQERENTFVMRPRNEESSLLSTGNSGSTVFTNLPGTYAHFKLKACPSRKTVSAREIATSLWRVVSINSSIVCVVARSSCHVRLIHLQSCRCREICQSLVLL